MTNKRNQYTREFKLEAISLVVDHKRKIPDVADSLGIGKSTLQKWLSQYRQEMTGQAPKVGNALTDEQRELQELRKENKRLRMERDILKKASALLASLGQPERLSLISQLAEQDKQVNKSLLCKLFGVMKSSYYYGLKPKPISLDTVKTKALIRQIFNDSKQSAGARSIAAILMNEHNIKLSRYVVGKLMAQMRLKSCQLKTHKYKHADGAHKTHKNILNGDFSPSAPNQVWTGDVTYIRIKGGWCYLAVVLDLYARRVVGFAVSDSPDSMLTTKALQMAYQTRLQPIGVLFHSDQGTHYTSEKFAESVASCDGMKQSMSRKGNCWDNAPTERFFRSFKTEWMLKGGYENIAEAKSAIVDYIWRYYQTVRPHRFNDYLPPLEKEKRYFNQNLLLGVLN